MEFEVGIAGVSWGKYWEKENDRHSPLSICLSL